MTTAPVGRLDEREAFEAWFRSEYHDRLCRNMPDKSYNDPTAHATWGAWQARSASRQEGWQLVPVEPTPKMIGAAQCYGRDDYGNIDPAFAYHHMLAAAPHQSQEAQGDRHG